MTYVTRLSSGHVAVCQGRRVLSVHCTRKEARKRQRRYNHRWTS